MKAENLRKSILRYAIEGKLVPQIATEEPASILLERIKKEKSELIKQGKIKKEKALPAISDEEKPFDIPESWQWVRFTDIAVLFTGDSINAHEKKTKYLGLQEGYNYIATKDVGFNNAIDYDNGVKIPFENTFKVATQFSSLLCIEGGSAGRKVGLLNQDVCFGNKLCCFSSIQVNYLYLFYFLQSPIFTMNFTDRKSGMIGGVGVNTLKTFCFALPPLSEQQRIVEKIEELMLMVDDYEQKQVELEKLEKEFPEKLKKSVLQYAIQGKLVPQMDTEEPASILLEKIKKEKAELIKQGKIKKEKPLPAITDEEKPFEIPDSWEWAKMGDLAEYKKGPFGSSLTKAMFVPESNNSIKVYEQKNAIGKNYRLGDYYITKEKYSEMTGFTVLPQDIIVSCAGTIGETYLIPDDAPIGVINQALMRIRTHNKDIQDYFLLFFRYIVSVSSVLNGNGSAIKNIPPLEELKNILIPIPPLMVQRKIIEKLDCVHNLIHLISNEKRVVLPKEITVNTEPQKDNIIPMPKFDISSLNIAARDGEESDIETNLEVLKQVQEFYDNKK